MSLGLFNCRLIQPAGDQLFFLSAVLPHRCQFGQALFSLLVTRPARSRPAGGRRMLPAFPSQKAFVLVFGEGEVPSDAEGFTPTDSPANSPKIPNPTHRFCYRTQDINKGVIMAALAVAGITSLVVTFDGNSDEGQIESIEARAGETTVELPATLVQIVDEARAGGKTGGEGRHRC